MLWIVIVGCVLASAFNAASSLLEREAAHGPHLEGHELFSRKLAAAVGKNKKFILGILFQLIASALEIVAISQGSLVLIGPLLTLDLVFLWLFIAWRYGLEINPRSWVAVSSLVVGLSILSICTHSRTDMDASQGLAWVITISIVVAIIVAGILLTRTIRSPKLRAGIMGFCTACNYALDAGLVKLLTDRLQTYGHHSVIFAWPLYALIIFALLSIWLTQNTFSAGPLTISQPVIEIVQAAATSLIGILVFEDFIARSALIVVGASCAAVLIGIGAYILATTKELFSSG